MTADEVELYAGPENLEAYKVHSAILRTWLVAYGIGAPPSIKSPSLSTARCFAGARLRLKERSNLTIV